MTALRLSASSQAEEADVLGLRELAAFALRTLRPQDAKSIYAQPRGEMRRLEQRGVLHRLAHGYYVVGPQDQTGTGWMPALETAAAGNTTADFGPANATLVTTPEQTVLDLARRPELGEARTRCGLRSILIARADVDLLEELATA